MAPETLSAIAHVPAAARGDRDAFAVIVDATRSLVSSIALAIVRDVELSQDVAQDVFLSAWKDLRQLRDPQSLLPWLRQLTRHRAYHVLRGERRRTRRMIADTADELLASAADPRPQADMRAIAEEERQLLAVVLDELPDDTREIVTLFYREGESTAQVSSLLGLSEAAVRQRLSRARTRIRAGLLDRYGETARRSVPGSRFTAAVLAAIAVGAPSAASAATAAAATAASPSIIMKAITLLGGAGLGAASGVAGVLHGTRALKRMARTADELAALRRFEAASVAIVLAASAGFPILWMITHSPWSQVACFAAFVVGLGSLHVFWLPRIVRVRHAMEHAEDPLKAARDRARERFAARLGWGMGLLSGTAGLLAGL